MYLQYCTFCRLFTLQGNQFVKRDKNYRLIINIDLKSHDDTFTNLYVILIQGLVALKKKNQLNLK